MRLIILAAIVGAAACGGSDSTSPGADGGSNQASLAGTWTGTIGQTGQANPVALSWVVSASGSALSGPVTATSVENGQSFSFAGTLSGTVSSNGVSLSLSFPAGTFTSLGGPSTCSMTGSGNTAFTNNTPPTLSGSMTLTWAASCVGNVAEKATETNQITLSRK